MDEQGVSDLADRVDDCSAVAAVANALFAIPPRTLSGAIEKLKIVRLAVGDRFEADREGDDGIDDYQGDSPWFPTVIADFERLAGRAS